MLLMGWNPIVVESLLLFVCCLQCVCSDSCGFVGRIENGHMKEQWETVWSQAFSLPPCLGFLNSLVLIERTLVEISQGNLSALYYHHRRFNDCSLCIVGEIGLAGGKLWSGCSRAHRGLPKARQLPWSQAQKLLPPHMRNVFNIFIFIARY